MRMTDILKESSSDLDLNQLQQRYYEIVDSMVADGQNGVFYSRDNNPLVGVIRAISHVCSVSSSPNPLMGLEVSNGTEIGTVVPAPTDSSVPMVLLAISGRVLMTSDIWVPRKFARSIVAPSVVPAFRDQKKLPDPPKKDKGPKRNIPDVLPDWVEYRSGTYLYQDEHTGVRINFDFGTDPDEVTLLVSSVSSRWDMTKVSSSTTRKKYRDQWLSLGREGKPHVSKDDVLSACRKVRTIGVLMLSPFAKEALARWGVAFNTY